MHVARLWPKTSHMPKASKTSKSSTARRGAAKSTLSPADSPASLFPLLESEPEQTTHVRSGRKCYELYGRYSPLGSLVKMLLVSPAWGSPIVSLTWKAKAIGRNRFLYQLVPSVPSTGETEFGLLPTHTAKGNHNRKGLTPTSGDGLETALKKLLPTPTASDTNKLSRCESNEKRRGSLPGQLMKLLPTPTANDGNNCTMPQSQQNRDSIPGALMNMGVSPGTHLKVSFYEKLMGFPEGWTEIKPDE